MQIPDEHTIETSNDDVLQALQFSQQLRTLDERHGLHIALALAGLNKELFVKLYEVTKKQHTAVIKTSQLELHPAPAVPADLVSRR